MKSDNMYFFNFEEINTVRDNITAEENKFLEEYLSGLLIELDEKMEVYCPFTAEAIKDLIIHSIRSYKKFQKDK